MINLSVNIYTEKKLGSEKKFVECLIDYSLISPKLPELVRDEIKNENLVNKLETKFAKAIFKKLTFGDDYKKIIQISFSKTSPEYGISHDQKVFRKYQKSIEPDLFNLEVFSETLANYILH